MISKMFAVRFSILSMLLLVLLMSPSLLFAQNKNGTVSKTVCSSKIPSRFSSITQKSKAGIKSTSPSSKKMSCCKGVPSRFSSSASYSHQNQKKAVVKN